MKGKYVLSLSHTIQYILLIFILLLGTFIYLNVPSHNLRIITAVILLILAGFPPSDYED